MTGWGTDLTRYEKEERVVVLAGMTGAVALR